MAESSAKKMHRAANTSCVTSCVHWVFLRPAVLCGMYREAGERIVAPPGMTAPDYVEVIPGTVDQKPTASPFMHQQA